MSEYLFGEIGDDDLIVREVFVRLCAKAHSRVITAILLDQFDKWTVEALESGQDAWVTKSIDDMVEMFYYQFERRYVAKMVAWLIKQGFITRRNNPDETNDTPQYLLNVAHVQNAIDKIEVDMELEEEARWDYGDI